jgi:hypothetical protein
MKVVMLSCFMILVKPTFSILKFIAHIFLLLRIMVLCGRKLCTTPGPSQAAQAVVDFFYFYHDFIPKEDPTTMRALEVEVRLV